MNTRPRKFDYFFVLQGHYGHGWEDLSQESKHGPTTMERVNGKARRVTPHKRIKADARAYRENEGGCYRIITRRELRECAA